MTLTNLSSDEEEEGKSNDDLSFKMGAPKNDRQKQQTKRNAQLRMGFNDKIGDSN